MARGVWMRRYARWHIWLGWIVGVPLLLWTLSGVVMVLKPIEEVRGDQLRMEHAHVAIGGRLQQTNLIDAGDVVLLRTFVQRGRLITLATGSSGSVKRYDTASGVALPALTEGDARMAIAADIREGDRIAAMRAFPAGNPPLDLRKPVPVWQATLADGAHIYINRDSGEIEAVRTRWWRIYDFVWGIHIMDLQTREDAHNPFTIAFGSLSLLGALLGLVLLFRRRKARGAG